MQSFNDYLRLRESTPIPDFKVKKFNDVPGGDVKKDGVFYPKRTLNIPRSQMPQTKSREDFFSWLTSRGISYKRIMIAPKDIIRDPITKEKRVGHAQQQIYPLKSLKFVKKGTTLEKPIVLSKDGIIFDGNHHWLALMAIAPKVPAPAVQVDMDFEPLRQLVIKEYPNVSFEEWLRWYN